MKQKYSRVVIATSTLREYVTKVVQVVYAEQYHACVYMYPFECMHINHIWEFVQAIQSAIEQKVYNVHVHQVFIIFTHRICANRNQQKYH